MKIVLRTGTSLESNKYTVKISVTLPPFLAAELDVTFHLFWPYPCAPLLTLFVCIFSFYSNCNRTIYKQKVETLGLH